MLSPEFKMPRLYLHSFGKKVCVEAARQLNAAYWQLRNKTAIRIYEEETKKRKIEWCHKKERKDLLT